MKIVVGEKEIELNKKEVLFSRKLVDSFIEVSRAAVPKRGMSQYITTILYMYIKASKLIDSLGLDNMETLLNYLNEKKEENLQKIF